jgi:dTDP-4-amino-4,6-dideoxygalactose transaminase
VIPYADLKAQYHGIKTEVDAAISRVLESSAFILGKEVAAFEEEFAAYCESPHAIGVNSGTSALHLAMLAAGIGPGDEVITVPFTFVATVAAIGYTGARPVFVDIDPAAYTMDPAQVEAAITPRTRAIVPVHLYGQTADMDPILAIARRHNLTVIEDAAQAHGARYKGRRTGSLADLACFSFYPGKNLGAYGEGGAVVTANPEYARAIRMLRDWGQQQRYEHTVKGYNYRLEGMQGAILRVKLRKLDEWTALRQAVAADYTRQLAGAAACTPRVMEWGTHVFHVYAVRTPRRWELQHALAAKEIQTGVHYPIPIHLQPAWKELGYGPGAFPVSERVANEVLSLPIFAELTGAQVAEVSAAVRDFPG